MKIGDEVYIHGYVDEIRKDTIIIRNKGGYFGTVSSEVVESPQPEIKYYGEFQIKDPVVISAQPEQRWIPCSERLPEDEQNVLVTYKTTDKIHPCQYHDDGSRNPWYSYIDQCRAHMNVVLAWMPLPEPYQGEGEHDG